VSPAPRAALGLRVKSGWAMAVLLAGPPSAPRVLDRRRVELSDRRIPRTAQPYHAGFGVAQSSQRVVARLVRIVEQCARRSFAELRRRHAALRVAPRGIGLVVGSLGDPAHIANPHIRAHAEEGALFRRVAEDAARHIGLAPIVVLERDVYRRTARAVRRSAGRVQAMVTAMGTEIPGRWRSEEKTAAAAAWLVLAGRVSRRR
jgi:hypothetical protein